MAKNKWLQFTRFQFTGLSRLGGSIHWIIPFGGSVHWIILFWGSVHWVIPFGGSVHWVIPFGGSAGVLSAAKTFAKLKT